MVADRLAELHFAAQDQRPSDLEDVEIVHLDGFLRGLLFTDGTVSRALEAQTLAPVTVEPVEQTQTVAPAQLARYLEIEQTDECIRRRVVMRIAGRSSSIWAESYVAPQRLPPDFLALLERSSVGIGGSLAQLKLESWRELLWFGLGPPPEWSGSAAPSATTLTRLYRIITQRQPALLISEAFAVEMRSGVFHLMGSADTPADSAAAQDSRAAQGSGAPQDSGAAQKSGAAGSPT